MRFDDDAYLMRYYDSGEFPRIHDDIFMLAKGMRCKRVIDLGSCTGLLSARLATVFERVYGIEGNDKYISKRIVKDNITYKKMYVTPETLPELARLIKSNGITGVVARRVIPEIQETGGVKLCRDLARCLHDAGIEQIALEGRKSNRNAVNPLYSIDKEIEVFSGFYGLEERRKNCAMLRRIK